MVGNNPLTTTKSKLQQSTEPQITKGGRGGGEGEMLVRSKTNSYQGLNCVPKLTPLEPLSINILHWWDKIVPSPILLSVSQKQSQ